MEARTGFIDLAGVRIHYREWGDPALPPLVLLHGLGADSSTWDPVAPALADLRRVVTLDQRGSGRSGRPGTYSFDLMAADAAGCVRARQLGSVDLIGHSMGGSVAYAFARLHPGLLRRLVIEDTPPPTADTTRALPTPDSLAEVEELMDPRMLVAILAELHSAPLSWWDDLAGIARPTLMIRGGDSRIPREELVRAAARIPDCRLVEIAGAGHAVHSDRPGEFVAVVRDFLVA